MGRKERAFLDDAALAPKRGKELTKLAFAKEYFFFLVLLHHLHTLHIARTHPREAIRWLVPQIY
jgi:hypothetical protein